MRGLRPLFLRDIVPISMMQLVTVIPLTRLPRGAPEILSYYTIRDIPAGSFVKITINKRRAVGMACASTPLADMKALVRRQDFSLRKIDAVLGESILPEYSVKLILWAAKYFIAPKPSMFKAALPNYVAKPSTALQKFLKNIPASLPSLQPPSRRPAPPIFIEGDFRARCGRYARELKELRNHAPEAQALLLFPTTADAENAAEIFRKEFSAVSLYTSALSDRNLAEEWKKILLGETRLIIGTRNAIFVPAPNLSRVIIDGEHSIHFKSWDQHPKFDARDVAEKIAETLSIPLLLGGNIPREETWHRIQEGSFAYEKLSNQKNIPIDVIDVQKETNDESVFRSISVSLQKKIAETLARGERTFIFSGRRGYSSNLLCRDCGEVMLCARCDSPLTIHITQDVFSSRVCICHKCLKREFPPSVCPECQSPRIEGFSIGSQRIEEELKKIFPAARLLRIDADSMDSRQADVPDDPKELSELFARIENGRSDIIIGTELALKPSVVGAFALTAVISLSQLLQWPDFRQEERAFGIVRQLLEITGRECVIQTRSPSSFLVRELLENNADAFFKRDIAFRKEFFYPPFAEIIKITVADSTRLYAEKNSLIVKHALAEEFAKGGVARESLFLIGPVPAFIPKEKNEYIYHIILKVKNQHDEIKRIVRANLPNYASVEVNPKTIL